MAKWESSTFSPRLLEMTHRRQFSIRALLIATLVVALILGTFQWIGHYLVFGSSLVLCVGCAWWALRRRANWRGKLLLVASSVFFGGAACFLSIGPASWMLARYLIASDGPSAKAEKVYSPLYVPIATTIIYSPAPVRRAGMWYVAKWMPRGTQFHADWPDGMGWTSKSTRDPYRGWTYTVVHY